MAELKLGLPKPPKDVLKNIYNQELQLWSNTIESLLLKHRVYVRLESKQDQENILKELEKCEKAVDEIQKAIAELDSEG